MEGDLSILFDQCACFTLSSTTCRSTTKVWIPVFSPFSAICFDYISNKFRWLLQFNELKLIFTLHDFQNIVSMIVLLTIFFLFLCFVHVFYFVVRFRFFSSLPVLLFLFPMKLNIICILAKTSSRRWCWRKTDASVLTNKCVWCSKRHLAGVCMGMINQKITFLNDKWFCVRHKNDENWKSSDKSWNPKNSNINYAPHNLNLAMNGTHKTYNEFIHSVIKSNVIVFEQRSLFSDNHFCGSQGRRTHDKAISHQRHTAADVDEDAQRTPRTKDQLVLVNTLAEQLLSESITAARECEMCNRWFSTS